jgi:ribosomal RNA-processing protein 36
VELSTLTTMEAASSSGSDNDDDSSVSVSSSSDNDDSSSVVEQQQPPLSSQESKRHPKAAQEQEDSSDSDSDSVDSDNNQEGSDDESSSSNNDSSDEEDHQEDVVTTSLSLDQRLQKQEQEGVSLSAVRARKAKALQVAAERIAKLKKKKQQQHDRDNGGSSSSDESDDDSASKNKKSKKSKHKPTEVSSKRSDFFKRGARNLNESGIGVEIGAHRYKPMDPRMSSLSGHFNEEQFDNNYEFVNELRAKEIARLKKCVQAYKVTGRKGKELRRKLNITGGSLEEYQEKLKALQAEKANQDRRKLERVAKSSVKKKIREEVAQGKRGVYYLKRKEQKRLELEAKFDELRKRGGDKAVDKLVAKKRRKNKSRDAGLFAK